MSFCLSIDLDAYAALAHNLPTNPINFFRCGDLRGLLRYIFRSQVSRFPIERIRFIFEFIAKKVNSKHYVAFCNLKSEKEVRNHKYFLSLILIFNVQDTA